MKPIGEILKKTGRNISAANTDSTSSTNPGLPGQQYLPGDPLCPLCAGVGFVRQDLPVGHPDFGKVQICTCRGREVAQSSYQKILNASNLDAFQYLTFETFKAQGRIGQTEDQILSLKNAFDQAQTYAQLRRGWLLLLGGYGVGKTHLAAAIANKAVTDGVHTIFLTVPDLLDWLRYSMSSTDVSYETRFEEIRNVDLLVLDDLGTQNATPWAEEKLFQLINHRYVHQLPTVITTNQELDQLDGRISSRLRDPELVAPVKINAQDYRHPLQETTQARLSSLDLYSRQTFGTFSLREHERLPREDADNLERAYHKAQQFADQPRGWLVFTGPYGSGKTHLAAAIGNYRQGQESSMLFVEVPDLLDHLRSTFSPNSDTTYDKMFEEVRGASLLILDNLSMQSATPWAREKLNQILTYRYVTELPTVITTADPLDQIDPRIRSRMLDTRLCVIFAITAPPFRGAISPAMQTSDKVRRTTRRTG